MAKSRSRLLRRLYNRTLKKIFKDPFKRKCMKIFLVAAGSLVVGYALVSYTPSRSLMTKLAFKIKARLSSANASLETSDSESVFESNVSNKRGKSLWEDWKETPILGKSLIVLGLLAMLINNGTENGTQTTEVLSISDKNISNDPNTILGLHRSLWLAISVALNLGGFGSLVVGVGGQNTITGIVGGGSYLASWIAKEISFCGAPFGDP